MFNSLTGEWMSANAAQKDFSLTSRALARAVAEGRVRVRRERGQPPRYARADLMVAAGFLARD